MGEMFLHILLKSHDALPSEFEKLDNNNYSIMVMVGHANNSPSIDVLNLLRNRTRLCGEDFSFSHHLHGGFEDVD